MSHQERSENQPSPTESSSTVVQERKMRLAFIDEAEKILDEESAYKKTGDGLVIGLEFECSIITPDFRQSNEATRNLILAEHRGYSDVELGATQIEWVTDPIDLNAEFGVQYLVAQVKYRQSMIEKSASQLGVHLLSSGTNPFVPIAEIARTNKPKYQTVPNYHNDNKRPGLNTLVGVTERVDVRDAAIISLHNSIQCNLDAGSFQDAIDKLNRSFAIGPMAVAIGANAQLLEGKDTGIADLRMINWEISHDTRTKTETEEGKLTRVGLPGSYYADVRDYFQRIAAKPFILHIEEAAFPIGIGLNWQDTRIKFLTDKKTALVEFRPVSVQPSPEENIAMMLFYTGRLLWSQQHNEPLLPLDLVRHNRNSAMNFGLNSNLWTRKNGRIVSTPANEALLLEIVRARKGLKQAGVNGKEVDTFLQILVNRAKQKETPASRSSKLYETKLGQGMSNKEAMVEALKDTGSLVTK